MDQDDFMFQYAYKSITQSLLDTFSVRNVQYRFKKLGIPITSKEIRFLLDADPNVLQINEDCYLTRAGLLTGKQFAIKPTEFEFKNKIFIPGTRSVPFVKQEIFPHTITFKVFTKPAPKKVISLPYTEALKYYSFIGAEFFPHYLANDPANEEIIDSLYNGEASIVNLTVIDMTTFYERYEFEYGDYIMGILYDWENAEIQLLADERHDYTIFYQKKIEESRKKWEEGFANNFIHIAENYGIPRSIEEQIFYTYFLTCSNNANNFTGSIENAIANCPKICYVDFGLESRLWLTNQKVIAKGNCFVDYDNAAVSAQYFIHEEAIVLRNSVLSAYAKMIVYEQVSNNVKLKLDFFDNIDYFGNEGKQFIYQEVKQRISQIKRNYNLMKDYNIADVRKSGLELYNQMYSMAFKMHVYDIDLEQYDQDDLIIFIQGFIQLGKTFDELEIVDDQMTDDEYGSFSNAIAGMSFAFEEVRVSLQDTIEKFSK